MQGFVVVIHRCAELEQNVEEASSQCKKKQQDQKAQQSAGDEKKAITSLPQGACPRKVRALPPRVTAPTILEHFQSLHTRISRSYIITMVRATVATAPCTPSSLWCCPRVLRQRALVASSSSSRKNGHPDFFGFTKKVQQRAPSALIRRRTAAAAGDDGPGGGGGGGGGGEAGETGIDAVEITFVLPGPTGAEEDDVREVGGRTPGGEAIFSIFSFFCPFPPLLPTFLHETSIQLQRTPHDV